MTSYTKTMMDALAEVRDLQEDNMDLMRKAAGKGGMQTLKMKDGKLKMDKVTASAIMQIYDKLNPANQKKMEQMINNGKKSGIIKVSDFAMSKVTGFKSEDIDLDEVHKGSKGVRQLIDPKKEVMVVKKNKVVVIDKKDLDKYEKQGWSLAEEVELDEAPKYELYHKDFSSAMQHAYKMAKKLHGITVKPSEIDDKVASGPRKPSEGKTNSYRLEGDKGAIQVQVYNKGGSKPYELNFYKEEVEIDEAKVLAKKGNMQVINDDGVIKLMKGSKVVSSGDYDRGAGVFFMGAKQQSFDSAEDILKMKEEVEIDEDKLPDMRDALMQVRAEKPIQLDEQLAKIKGNTPADKGRRAAVEDDIERAEKKGDKKEVAKLKEDEELDEGKMKELHGYIEDGKSAEWIAKKMGVDVKTIKALMSGYKEAYELGTNEYREYLEKLTPGEMDEKKINDPNDPKTFDPNQPIEIEDSARADAKRAMRADPSMKQDPFSKDDDATDDDVKGASKNIIMQMRKVVSMRGNFDVEFLDKKKKKVPVKIAQAVQDKYNSFKKPADKEKFQAQAAKSYNDMLKVLKAGYMMKAAYEEVEIDEAKERQISYDEFMKQGGDKNNSQWSTGDGKYKKYWTHRKEEVEIDEGPFAPKKVTKKERDRLEDQNEHGLLALKLAQAYGTPNEVQKVREINRRHENRGHITKKDQQERTAISSKYYRMAEEVDLDEAKIAFKTKAKDGGYFVVLHRDTSGMKGKQDKFLMRHMKGGKVKDWGSHSSVDGAKKFAINRGIIDEETILERIDRKLKERKNG